MNTWLAVFIGGGMGSILRLAISRALLLLPVSVFPWATLVSNVSASVVLAIFTLRWQHSVHDADLLRSFIAIGFCGGLSTFSTFSYENFILVRSGLHHFAIANIVISVLLCLLVLFLFARSA